ncbi:flagellar filament capping protein FliD [Paenibacillus shenyangensis]|uniref:flagellar filament capping protein FliD n=1 Tax=Paenibacillus sp. A9 TaxID=1284352 RepID=UPI000375015C|nr:flagellar filament capping protein FliD [Paenibacillus sp. A9]
MSYMTSASSVLRVSGGASGMDTDSIVKQLMAAQRIPLDKLNQNKQVLEWKRDSYREINSKLVDFRQNKLFEFKKSESLNAQKAVVAGNTSAMTATANADASGIPMNVTIGQLATKATATGAALTTNAGNGKVTTATTVGQLSGNTDDYTVSINGENLTFKSTETLSAVISKINSNSKAGASATFNEVTGQFSINAKEFGGTLNLDNADSGQSFLSLSKISERYPSNIIDPDDRTKAEVTVNGTSLSFTGAKAKATIDGTPLTFNSNTNTLNGVTMNFLAVSGSAGATNITTQTDTTKVVDTVKAFVTAYNDLLNTMKTKTEESKYKDFAPLTSEQKKSMSDDDITAWTTKAKSGMLKGDDILKTALQDMRNVITSALGQVPGGVSLPDMGITTGSYSEGGKLYLDEEKLKKAVANNPQGVMTTLKGSAADTSGGVFNKLYDKLNETVTKFYDRAGTSKLSTDVNAAFSTKSIMAKELTDYNTRINALTSRLNDVESRYYKQFSAMESALSKLNSQSSSLAGYLKS